MTSASIEEPKPPRAALGHPWRLGLACWMLCFLPFTMFWDFDPSGQTLGVGQRSWCGVAAFLIALAAMALAAKRLYPLQEHIRLVFVVCAGSMAALLLAVLLEAVFSAATATAVSSCVQGAASAVTLLAWVEFLGVLDTRELVKSIAASVALYGVGALATAPLSLIGLGPGAWYVFLAALVALMAWLFSASWRLKQDASRPSFPESAGAPATSTWELVASGLPLALYGLLFALVRTTVANVPSGGVVGAAAFVASGATILAGFAFAARTPRKGHEKVAPYIRVALAPAVPCCMAVVFLGGQPSAAGAFFLYFALGLQAFFVTTVFADVTLHAAGNSLVVGGTMGACFAAGMAAGLGVCAFEPVAATISPVTVGMAPAAALALCASLLIALAYLPQERRQETPAWGYSLLEEPQNPAVDLSLACEAVARRYGLTKRETEVLSLLARGRDQKYVERTLVVSASTAKTHIYHVLKKTGAHSRQEVIDIVEKCMAADFDPLVLAESRPAAPEQAL